MTSPPASKRPRTTDASSSSTDPPYKLHYWPTLPGRGEPIRLCFEATKTPYEDVTNRGAGMSALKSLISPTPTTAKNNNNNPPHFAPPVLEHGDLTISQLPNILLYLGPKLSLAGGPSDANAIHHINQLALTALDGFLTEAHETHHPISISSFYEDQKPAALARARDYTANRLPKFLAYFENVLKSESSGGGEWLYGGRMTYADLVLWQGLDGVSFAFPEKVRGLREGREYGGVWGLYERVKGLEAVEGYLGSERRLRYGKGIWRYYEELDGGVGE